MRARSGSETPESLAQPDREIFAVVAENSQEAVTLRRPARAKRFAHLGTTLCSIRAAAPPTTGTGARTPATAFRADSRGTHVDVLLCVRRDSAQAWLILPDLRPSLLICFEG